MRRNILKGRIVDVCRVRIPAPRLRGGRLRAHDRCCIARMTGNGRGGIQVLKVCVVLALVVWAFSSSADSPKYMKHNPSDPAFPYVYGKYDTGKTKGTIQWELSLMTDDPEEFVKVFDFFKLDISWRSKDILNDSYLTRATGLKDWALVKPLIDRKINIDWQSSHGTTALMYAAGCGHLSTVGRLLVAGADPTLVDQDGDSALSNAKLGQNRSHCPEGDYERVKELLTEALADSETGNDVADSKAGNRIVKSPQENDSDPLKYGAIAYKPKNVVIRTWLIDQTSSHLAHDGVEEKCNRLSRQLDKELLSPCEVVTVFSTGRCGAYALSEPVENKGVGWGGGNSSIEAEMEAIQMCNEAVEQDCRIVLSKCQE